jgi:acyl dehydratase
MTRDDDTREGVSALRPEPYRLTSAWIRASGHLANSVLEANRATLAAFGLDNGDGEDGRSNGIESTASPADETGGSPQRGADREAGAREEGLPSVAYDRGDWETTRSAETGERIGVGDSVTFSKRLTDADVRAFAEASGDTNRLHLDEEFAEQTRFGGRIVHGTLVSGLVSAALARLPGLTIYLSQDVRFTDPVEIGDRLTATVEVVEDLGKGRYRLSTDVTDGDGDVVIDGEAVVLIDEALSSDDARDET